MKRVTFPHVLIVLLVFVWSLPMLGWANCSTCSKHKEEKGQEKTWSAVKGDHKGEYAKEHSMATLAGKKQHKGENAIECLMTLKAKLQLEDDQMAEVKALLEAKKEGLKATMEHLKEIGASKEEFKKAIQEASTGFEANLTEILTSEQAAKYKELKTGFKKWGTKQSGGTCEKKDPLAGLNLTDEQKAEFNEITERYHEMQEELFEQMMGDLNGVLTPEQIEEFKAMKEHHKKSGPVE